MKKLFLAVAMIVGSLFPSTVSAAPDPNTCIGYPEPRVGIEIQSWWQDRVGEAFPGRHIHIFTCWPTGVVTGTVHLDLKIQTHAQPDNNYFKRLRATDGGGSDVFPAQTSGFTPLDANGDMVQWIGKDINTTGLSTGLHEIRLAGYVRQTRGTASTSDDFDQLVSSGLPLFVRSLSGGATSRDYVESRSWYPVFEYTNSRYIKRLADFLTAKSGVWKPVFQCASPSGENADTQTTTIDPSFHVLNPGTTVGSFTGEGTRTITVDTTRFANGDHKIVNLCAATANLGGHDGTSTGVLAINFKINN